MYNVTRGVCSYVLDIHCECNYNLKLLLVYFAVICIDKIKSKRTYEILAKYSCLSKKVLY